MAKQIILPHGWHPRPYQSKLWNALEGGTKRCIEVAHRRWGKDDLALHWSAVSAMQRPATLWHMLPQIRWRGRQFGRPSIRIRGSGASMKVSLTRYAPSRTKQKCSSVSRTAVHGKSSARQLRHPCRCLLPLASASLNGPCQSCHLWPTSPDLVENNGWALFITTPLGNNHAKAMYDMARNDPEWFAEISTVADTQAISTKRSRRSAKYITHYLETPQAMR